MISAVFSQNKKVFILKVLFWVWFPSMMFLVYNSSKALLSNLLGIPAKIHYNIVTFDMLEVGKLAEATKREISTTFVVGAILILYLFGFLGYLLVRKYKEKNTHILFYLGLFFSGFLLKPFLTFIQRLYVMIFRSQENNYVGDEYRIGLAWGINEWIFPILLMITSLYVFYLIFRMFPSKLMKFQIGFSIVISMWLGLHLWSWLGKYILP